MPPDELCSLALPALICDLAGPGSGAADRQRDRDGRAQIRRRCSVKRACFSGDSRGDAHPEGQRRVMRSQALGRWHTGCAKEGMSPLNRAAWIVYTKRLFGDAQQVHRYSCRYTRRIAISNACLPSSSPDTITLRTRDDQVVTKVEPCCAARRARARSRPTGWGSDTRFSDRGSRRRDGRRARSARVSTGCG